VRFVTSLWIASSITSSIKPAMVENIHPPLPAPCPMPRTLRSHPSRTAPTMRLNWEEIGSSC
jgi:hypothetical protein